MRSGKSPIALRVRLSDDSGFDLTEAGTKKSLAAYIARDIDPRDGERVRPRGPA
jgi:formamidopyrimidine-DNA glycosylase